MYKRFLNNEDYLSVISLKSLSEITRDKPERFEQAESDAEIAIVENLSENYEIEKEILKGKYIAQYDRKITFPVGVYFYFSDKLYKAIRSISGFKAPSAIEYWKEYTSLTMDNSEAPSYSQFATYYPGDIVQYAGDLYECLAENGFDFNDIRIPMVNGWIRAQYITWSPTEYELWDVVKYDGDFFTLITLDGFDNNVDPATSDCWGAIADYDSAINNYELSSHEYVVYAGEVYYPEMDVNSDVPVVGVNITESDPRNANIKKHMVRLAVYELTKLIAPNNVSVIRVADYEASMKWLQSAAKLKINPQIPRKIEGGDGLPVLDWQLATYQTNYDVSKNPWIT